MVTVHSRARRVLESKAKIEPPFALDESLCLYSPQDNVDALCHPRIADWLRFIQHDYVPKLPRAARRVLLLMPCTKTKPYPFSSEHKHINQRLVAAGFRPCGDLVLPQPLATRLEPKYSRDVLNLAPLIDDHGTLVHRVVISEPMALVPYECIVDYDGKASPATAYDDPGLFENRGNAVSPWRADCTAIALSATRWRWGDEERRHYVLMHNAMAEAMAATIARIAALYRHRVLGGAGTDTSQLYSVAWRARRQRRRRIAARRLDQSCTARRQRSLATRPADRMPADAATLRRRRAPACAPSRRRHEPCARRLFARRRRRDTAGFARTARCFDGSAPRPRRRSGFCHAAPQRAG
jgi:hypothetical protein